MGALCCGDNGYKPDDSSRHGGSPLETGITYDNKDVGHLPATAKPVLEPKLPTATAKMLDSATEDISQAERQLDSKLEQMKEGDNRGRSKSSDSLKDEVVQQDADPMLKNMGALTLRNLNLQSKPNREVDEPLSPKTLAEMSKPAAMRA